MTKPTKWHVCPSKTQISLGIHPPSLIRAFAVRVKKAWVLSYPLRAQQRLWLDWADAQADLSLCWVDSHFVGFVMRWLISSILTLYLSQLLWKWYLLHIRTAKAQVSLCICAVLSEPSLFSHTIQGSRGSLRQKAGDPATLDGCAVQWNR